MAQPTLVQAPTRIMSDKDETLERTSIVVVICGQQYEFRTAFADAMDLPHKSPNTKASSSSPHTSRRLCLCDSTSKCVQAQQAMRIANGSSASELAQLVAGAFPNKFGGYPRMSIATRGVATSEVLCLCQPQKWTRGTGMCIVTTDRSSGVAISKR